MHKTKERLPIRDIPNHGRRGWVRFFTVKGLRCVQSVGKNTSLSTHLKSQQFHDRPYLSTRVDRMRFGRAGATTFIPGPTRMSVLRFTSTSSRTHHPYHDATQGLTCSCSWRFRESASSTTSWSLRREENAKRRTRGTEIDTWNTARIALLEKNIDTRVVSCFVPGDLVLFLLSPL